MPMKSFRITSILFIVTVFYGSVVGQVTLKFVLQQKIDSVRTALDIPSMAFSCVLPSGEMVSVSSGMKTHERMLAGSTGKTFFAAVALKLVKEGKLSLDDQVSTYLGKESWFSQVQNAETITI